ncbi:MAG: long-chain fatty acid--CoA ligase [Chloroflexi bacterium UTCFX4]|nr:MAG: long-chain fatty acid--CoA ligase [Chloroflexi bacterium UTCFX4]
MERVWYKNYEKGVPTTLDYPKTPLFGLLDNAAAEYPDRAAIIFGAVAHKLPGQPLLDATLSYRALRDAVNHFANALAQMGVKKGDRVAIYLPNSPQFAIAYYGALKAGAVIAPVNPIYTPRELEFILQDSGAETIVALSQFYPKLQEVRAKTKLKRVIVANIKEYFPPFLKMLFTLAMEKKEGHRVDLAAGDVWFQDVLKNAGAVPPKVDVQSNDDAVLLYTGGTTGLPKAAQLTHSNLLANAVQLRAWIPWAKEGNEGFLTALPLFHSYAMTTCLNEAMLLAGTLILIPNPRDLVHVLKAIDRHKPSFFPGVPTLYTAVNNNPEVVKYNLRSIKACVSGAAGLPIEVAKKFGEITGGRLVEGYGLSEASPVVTANPIYGENRIGTIGLPMPDTDVKLMDIEGGTKEVPIGEPGELCVQGPQVMKGYWNKPEETAKTIRDGWLHTGDVAVMDADGYFRIVDRLKEMIISGGYNIYPREIEEVLYQHPAVLEAAAIGVADSYRGESAKAFVVLKTGQKATADELIAFCKQNLAPYKVPRAIEFREALPKTMIGKILRRELAAEEKAKAAQTKQ